MEATSHRTTFGPELSPQAQAFVDALGPRARRMDRDIEELREEARELAHNFGGTAEAVASVDDVDANGVRARLYRSGSIDEGVLVWFHGGAWMLGDLDDHDVLASALANRARCSVLSVDYRLAPEHPYPAAIDDAWTATGWALDKFGAAAVGGDSSGGNLAAAVALRARDHGIPLVMQLLVYPALDAELQSPFIRDFIATYTDFAGDTAFGEHSVGGLRHVWDVYIPDPARRLDVDASPLRAPSLAEVAPALIILAEHDPLRGEGEEYARRLRVDDVQVDLEVYRGQIHGFFSLLGAMDDGLVAIDHSAAALKTAFQSAEKGYE